MPPRRRLSCLAAALVLVVVACGGGGGGAGGGSSSAIDGVTIEHAAGRTHRQGKISYPGKKPPTGGDHNPVPLTCGVYDQQPPDEYAVHSLEHGAVWVAYDPSTPSGDVATLRKLATHTKVIVSPYAGMDSPITLVAWEHRLEVARVDDPRVQQFVDTFAGARTAPEPTAACVGVGQPAS